MRTAIAFNPSCNPFALLPAWLLSPLVVSAAMVHETENNNTFATADATLSGTHQYHATSRPHWTSISGVSTWCRLDVFRQQPGDVFGLFRACSISTWCCSTPPVNPSLPTAAPKQHSKRSVQLQRHQPTVLTT